MQRSLRACACDKKTFVFQCCEQNERKTTVMSINFISTFLLILSSSRRIWWILIEPRHEKPCFLPSAQSDQRLCCSLLR